MRHDDRGQVVLPGNRLDAGLDGLLDDAVQGAQRFVQQQDAGLHHQRAGQGHALLLAAGKLVDALVQMFAQAQQLHQLPHLTGGADPRLVLQAVRDVPIGVQVGEQGIILEHDVEAAPLHGRAAHVLPVKKDLAAVQFRQPQDDVQQRSLSAAGRPQDGDDFPFPDVQADAVQNGNSVIDFLDVFQL